MSKRMVIDLQSGRLNIVDTERMHTLPLGTVLYCSSDELRKLADMMDDPQTTVDEIRSAAVHFSSSPKGKVIR